MSMTYKYKNGVSQYEQYFKDNLDKAIFNQNHREPLFSQHLKELLEPESYIFHTYVANTHPAFIPTNVLWMKLNGFVKKRTNEIQMGDKYQPDLFEDQFI